MQCADERLKSDSSTAKGLAHRLSRGWTSRLGVWLEQLFILLGDKRMYCRGVDGYILLFVHHSSGHPKSFSCKVCLPPAVYLPNGVGALNNHAIFIARMSMQRIH